MRVSHLICGLVAASLLAGCAGLSTPEADRNPAVKVAGSIASPLNITPLSGFVDEWSSKSAAGGDFSGAYTRLMIFSDTVAGADGDTAELKYEKRSLLTRALFGKDFSINLTAYVSVGSYETTVPLATIGHQSNSDGELWSRVIHHSKSDFPLFLVKNDGSASIPTVRVGVAGTKTYTSRGAATAVQAVLGIVRATSASSAVVTRLSEQSTKDRARAVDDAISKLFASGIAEDHWSDRDLRTWSVDKGRPRGASVDFRIPGDESDWNSTPHSVGRWTITFDFPRPSIFADWRICGDDNSMPRCAATREKAERKVHEDLDAGEVLNYALLNGANGLGTIRAILSQQDWYVAVQSALADKDKAKASEAAGGMCRRIRNEITGLGLNGFDSEIVVWAVVHGMPLPGGVKFFESVNDCKKPLDTIASHRKDAIERQARDRRTSDSDGSTALATSEPNPGR